MTELIRENGYRSNKEAVFYSYSNREP